MYNKTPCSPENTVVVIMKVTYMIHTLFISCYDKSIQIYILSHEIRKTNLSLTAILNRSNISVIKEFYCEDLRLTVKQTSVYVYLLGWHFLARWEDFDVKKGGDFLDLLRSLSRFFDVTGR